VKGRCQSILEEDGEWHEAIIQEVLENGKVKILFSEFGKVQEVLAEKLVLESEVVDNDDDLEAGTCVMCERFMPLTRHHVRPRTMHSKYLKLGFTQEELNKCIDICRPCHDAVHGTEDEPTLAKKLLFFRINIKSRKNTKMDQICKKATCP